MKKKPAVTRREFVAAAAAAATVMIVPRHAVAQSGKTPPSEKLHIAGIGVGGQGGADLQNLRKENIVALCDVDRAATPPAPTRSGPRPGSTTTSARCSTKSKSRSTRSW